MLRGLDISDMLIIDRLELAFQPGLNVLTGETGAGKSILLDALGFVLGWRGRADLVRDGADAGEVMASFHLSEDHLAHAVLAGAFAHPLETDQVARLVNPCFKTLVRAVRGFDELSFIERLSFGQRHESDAGDERCCSEQADDARLLLFRRLG